MFDVFRCAGAHTRISNASSAGSARDTSRYLLSLLSAARRRRLTSSSAFFRSALQLALDGVAHGASLGKRAALLRLAKHLRLHRRELVVDPATLERLEPVLQIVGRREHADSLCLSLHAHHLLLHLLERRERRGGGHARHQILDLLVGLGGRRARLERVLLALRSAIFDSRNRVLAMSFSTSSFCCSRFTSKSPRSPGRTCGAPAPRGRAPRRPWTWRARRGVPVVGGGLRLLVLVLELLLTRSPGRTPGAS